MRCSPAVYQIRLCSPLLISVYLPTIICKGQDAELLEPPSHASRKALT